MTIRNRTERSSARATAGVAATIGLAGAGALHALWASGSTWPAADAAELADVVVGRAREGTERRDGDTGPPPLPARAPTLAVAGLLGAASVLTAGASGLLPLPGRRSEDLARLGARVASGVLLARGTGGLVVSSTGLVPTTERFRRWNLRLYSPLCVGLGGAIVAATGGR